MTKISSTALIKGLFREMGIFGRTAEFSSPEFRGSVSPCLTGDNKRNFEGYEQLNINGIPAHIISGEIKFPVDQMQARAIIHRDPKSPDGFFLPKEILFDQTKLQGKAFEIDRSKIILEVRAKSFRAFGELIGLQDGFLDLKLWNGSLNPSTQVSIRGYQWGWEVLEVWGVVREETRDFLKIQVEKISQGQSGVPGPDGDLPLKIRLLEILLRCGYLRGKKAAIYQNHLELLDLIPSFESAKNWLKRFFCGDSHVSYLRLGEKTWFGQELGNGGFARGEGAQFLDQKVISFMNSFKDKLDEESKLILIYDESSSFNHRYWGPKIQSPHVRQFPILVIDDLSHLGGGKTSLRLKPAEKKQWGGQFKALSDRFGEQLLLGLGINNESFLAPSLKKELEASGYNFRRELALVYSEGKPIGLVISFGLPTFANLSFASSSIWIALPHPDFIPQVFSALASSRKFSHLLMGVTEAEIILGCDSKSLDLVYEKEEFPYRRFSLLVMPIRELKGIIELKGEKN